MMLCIKTIKYLYEIVLKGLNYQEQPVILKPFYALSALCLCVILAIPICSRISRMIEVDLMNEKQWRVRVEKR